MTSLLTLLLAAAAGFVFMLANLALKLMGHMPLYVLYPVVGTTVVIGCWLEVAAFRHAQFGLVVVMILGLEMLFSMVVARAFLGEFYTSANMAGVILMISGMGLLHLPAEAQPVVDPPGTAFRDMEVRKGPRTALVPEPEP